MRIESPEMIKARNLRLTWVTSCIIEGVISLCAILVVLLNDAVAIRDTGVGVVVIWTIWTLICSNIICYRFVIQSSRKGLTSFMYGVWLGSQAMLVPTFAILSLFFFSFSELSDETRAGGLLGFCFLCLAIMLCAFWVLVSSFSTDDGQTIAHLPSPGNIQTLDPLENFRGGRSVRQKHRRRRRTVSSNFKEEDRQVFSSGAGWWR